MKSYKKYIEPVIENILPLLKRPEFKNHKLEKSRDGEYIFTHDIADLVAMLNVYIGKIKSPLFELRSENVQKTTISKFYYVLHELYRQNVLMLYGFVLNKENAPEDVVKIIPHESGDKKKAKITRDVDLILFDDEQAPAKELGYDVIPRGRGLKMEGVPKKYRGILGRQRYKDKINMNKGNDAKNLWLVPKRGKTEDVYSTLREIHDNTSIEVRFHKFKDLSKIVRFRDASVANNKRRTGALALEQELAEEIQGKDKMVRASYALGHVSRWYAQLEHKKEEEIAKQKSVVDELKSNVQKIMATIVNEGMDAKTNSFKESQAKVEKFLKAEQKLNGLKQELVEIKDRHKYEGLKKTQAIRREVAEHFQGLKK